MNSGSSNGVLVYSPCSAGRAGGNAAHQPLRDRLSALLNPRLARSSLGPAHVADLTLDLTEGVIPVRHERCGEGYGAEGIVVVLSEPGRPVLQLAESLDALDHLLLDPLLRHGFDDRPLGVVALGFRNDPRADLDGVREVAAGTLVQPTTAALRRSRWVCPAAITDESRRGTRHSGSRRASPGACRCGTSSR